MIRCAAMSDAKKYAFCDRHFYHTVLLQTRLCTISMVRIIREYIQKNNQQSRSRACPWYTAERIVCPCPLTGALPERSSSTAAGLRSLSQDQETLAAPMDEKVACRAC